MKDKIKEFREKHPWLDAAAGFIPYVGEVQDILDFTHAASKNDYGGMALASLGLIIPGFTGGHIKKLAKFGEEAIGGTMSHGAILDKIAKGIISESKLTKEGLSKAQAKKLTSLSKEKFLTTSQRMERTELLVKYLTKSKGKKGSNIAITKAQEAGEDLTKKQERMYNELMKGNAASKLKEISKLVKHDYGSSIQWNWFDLGILAQSNIPIQTALGKAIINGVQDTLPIMLRFLNNMGGEAVLKTFKSLVKNGVLIPTEGRWVTPTKSGYELVDPTRFTLNYMLSKMKGNTNRINYSLIPTSKGTTVSEIPWHGTKHADLQLFIKYNDASKKPLFTTIEDETEGFADVINAYGRPTKLPVMRKTKEYERAQWNARPGTSRSSNSYDGLGELMSWFLRHPGKALEVERVSDVSNIPGNTGRAQNEYIFGVGTPDIKFLLNTFDFNGGKGAFTLKTGGKIK